MNKKTPRNANTYRAARRNASAKPWVGIKPNLQVPRYALVWKRSNRGELHCQGGHGERA